jgi:hypothetical protein
VLGSLLRSIKQCGLAIAIFALEPLNSYLSQTKPQGRSRLLYLVGLFRYSQRQSALLKDGLAKTGVLCERTRTARIVFETPISSHSFP